VQVVLRSLNHVTLHSSAKHQTFNKKSHLCGFFYARLYERLGQKSL